MLVELSISSWTARKLDKKVSAEVDVNNSTKTRAGNYNKNLLAGTGFLDTIIKYQASARNWHVANTLPWADNGTRLLPMGNFLTYKQNIAKLEQNYMALVAKFLVAYPNLVSAAAFQLGDLFDRSEYPDADSVAKKFKFSVNFLPVPMAGDFRIDINEEAKAEIISSCSKAYDERLQHAMSDAWDRLHKCLLRMSDRLEDEEVEEEVDGRWERVVKRKRLHDSMVENGVELVGLLKHFNLTKDARLEQARVDLENAIKGVDADTLRDNDHARQVMKDKVDAILGKFNF